MLIKGATGIFNWPWRNAEILRIWEMGHMGTADVPAENKA